MTTNWGGPPGGGGGSGDGPDFGRIVDISRHGPLLVKGGLLAAVLLFVIVGALTSAYTVQPEESAVVKRFGAIQRTEDPGLRFKLPFGIETAQLVPVQRILKEEFGFRTTSDTRTGQSTQQSREDESLVLTGDLNVIVVEWVVQYRIGDPEKYLYRGLKDPTQTLRDISEAVMRRIIGNRLGSLAITDERTDIQNQAFEEMQEILDGYNSGIALDRVVLIDVNVPDRVKPSLNEVNEARQIAERLVNQAEQERNQKIPLAAGEARQAISKAEGEAIERVNLAKGEAARFLSILEEYRSAPDVTRQRLYLEMVDKVMPAIGQLYVVPEGQMTPLPLLNLSGSPVTGEGGK